LAKNFNNYQNLHTAKFKAIYEAHIYLLAKRVMAEKQSKK